MILTDDIALALWRRALESEIGLSIKVKPEVKIKARDFLYEARQRANQLSLETIIMIMPGPHPEEIWLCRKSVEL